MAEVKVQQTIDYYEKLCERRPGNAFWAENLIDASNRLTVHNDHANFYRYLSDPENYQFESNIPTLRDLSDEQLQQIDDELVTLCMHDQKTTTFLNGTEMTMLIENTQQEDEKCDN